ncbi:hypothetical protein C2G38_2195419 [Gigaspora rosea]|uniref:Uncharacterized protein n=1 Tax=Gigaspora rosea TaxID=44941 RepID=A0A397UVP8_9GLOM|nr:hypothetical protein C2G38_2195419 [Gigaspora rosea]
MSYPVKNYCKESQLNIQTHSEISFDGSEESSLRSILSILSMSTSPRAEISAAAAQRNVNRQRRTDEHDDLINFETKEYEGEPTTPIPIYYKIQLNEEEENDDRIVIPDPDNVQVLPLHDVVTDNRYGNVDYQGEYEERYLHQRADRTYAYGYRRPQINDPIVAPLEPGTRPEDNRFI